MTGRSWYAPVDAGLLAVVVIVPLVLLRDAILGGGVIYERDVHLLWHGQIEGFVRAVAAGSWPTWDPWIGFGQPMLANANTQAYYPLTWLNLLMRPWTYYTIYAAVHLAWAGIGMFFLARALDVSRPGARVASVVWMASGPLLSLVNMWNHFAGAAWMPWVAAAALRLGERPQASRAAILGVALAAQFLAGSPDMSAYTGVVVATIVLAAVVRARRERGGAVRLLLLGGLSLAVTAALSAAQWMPTLAVVRASSRWALPDVTRLYWSVHPLLAFELLWPRLWPRPLISDDGYAALFESRDPFLISFYLGLPALGLVVAAFAAPRRRSGLMTAIGAAAVLAALGRHTPFFDLLVTAVPVLRLSRFPIKALPVATMAWAVLAGIGWDVWRDEAQVRFLRVAAILATVVACGLLLSVFAATLFPWMITGRPDLIPALLTAAPAILMIVVAVVRAARPAQARALAVAAALVAGAELIVVHRDTNPTAPAALFSHRPEVVDTLASAGRVYVRVAETATDALRDEGSALARLPAGWTTPAAEAMGQQLTLTPLSAARWGIRGSFAVDYMNMLPPYMSQLGDMFRLSHGTPPFERLLRMCGVTHVVTRDRGTMGGLVPVVEVPGLLLAPVRVMAVPSSRPRISLVGSSRRPANPLAILDPAFDSSREVLLPDGTSRMGPPDFAGAVEDVVERPDFIQVDVALSHPGFLVVLDTFDPEWKGRIDGAPVPVLRANNAFRAVAVPAGRHRVEMAYRPSSVRNGLVISLASALLMAGAAVWTRRRDRM